jgi:MFS superfamily sulfate permease-like transporter
VVIPKAMAYATVASLPIQVGLYTAFVPMVIYAVLGSSRVLSVSTTTTIAILVAADLAELTPGGDPALVLRAAATLSLMVGAFLAAASLLRLGFLANFISEPVLVGFKAGIGVVIVLDQLPKLLGVHFAKGTFLENLVALLQSLPGASATALALGLVAMALMLGIERFLPRVPAPLVAIGAGIAGLLLFGLADHGVETVGAIPQGLPRLTLPDAALVRPRARPRAVRGFAIRPLLGPKAKTQAIFPMPDLRLCPACGEGRLRVIAELDPTVLPLARVERLDSSCAQTATPG